MLLMNNSMFICTQLQHTERYGILSMLHLILCADSALKALNDRTVLLMLSGWCIEWCANITIAMLHVAFHFRLHVGVYKDAVCRS